MRIERIIDATSTRFFSNSRYVDLIEEDIIFRVVCVNEHRVNVSLLLIMIN